MPKLPPSPPSSEITPPETYLRRRELLKTGVLYTTTSAAVGLGLTELSSLGSADPPKKPPPMPKAMPGHAPWKIERRGQYKVDEASTPYEDVTTYNNYYELGLSKSEPAELGYRIKQRPWTIEVAGHVQRPQTLDIDALIRWFGLEERV